MANSKFFAHISGSVKFLREPSLRLKSLWQGKAAAAGGRAGFDPPPQHGRGAAVSAISLFERCGTPREPNGVPRGVTAALHTHVYLHAAGQREPENGRGAGLSSDP